MNKQQRRAKRMRARRHTKTAGQARNVGGRVEEVRLDRGVKGHLVRDRRISLLDRLGVPEPAEAHEELAKLGGVLSADPAVVGDLAEKVRDRRYAKGGKLEIVDSTITPNSGPHPTHLHKDEVELMSQEVWDEANRDLSEDYPVIHHTDEVELITDDGFIDVSSLAPMSDETQAQDEQEPRRMPTSQEWDDMVALAKKRKRAIVKVAEKAGWTLNEDFDPKTREGWTVLES
jgi:hypothetical protein